MEVMTVCGSWILCVGALLASPVRSELSILGCEAGSVDAVEGTDQLLTCGEYWIHGPQWTVYGDKGRQLYSGSCSWRPCTPSNEQFRLNKVYQEKSNTMFRSRLTIKSITRHSARQVVCSDNLTSASASCDLRILVPVSIVPKTCKVQLSGWKVNGVCTIQWLDTISDTSDCLWLFSYQSFPWATPEDIKGLLSSSSFVTVHSVGYKRRNCSFEQNMPVTSGDYSYNIRVSSHSDDQFSKTLLIEKPDPPQHNCSKIFLEGSIVTCTCFTSNLGNPHAQIGWAESSKEHFVIEGINRERNGTVITCSLTWGSINYTTPYTTLVAFGPSVTYISSSEETSGDETKTVLVCTASDVYPSALFRWNILCENETQNETTSSCTLPTSPVVDQTTIECTASNQMFAQVSSTTIYVLKPTHRRVQESIIGGSVAVGTIALVGVVIFLCIKRRNRSRGGNAQNETTNGNEGERTSKKSDSSTSSPGQAAGNGSKSGGSTPRSSSSGSDKPSTNPNYTSTALQEVEIHPYMDLHTRDPTYASTTSSKDPHMYMELKTLKALQPGSEKNGNDGYETPQVPGQANKSSDGYETPQPPREGRRRSATYANQGVPADPIQEEVNYYNEA